MGIGREKACEEVLRRLSRQRHDFLNHIQVVYAYLQIGKFEKALSYLEKIPEQIKEDESLEAFHCPKEPRAGK